MSLSNEGGDSSAKRSVLVSIRDILIIVGIVLLIKVFFIDFGFVEGKSMEPNLKDGEIIILKKWDIGFNKEDKDKGIHFYDKVVIKNVNFKTLNQPINIVKRVIGLPGDHIEIINGTIYRNGKMIKEPLITEKAVQPDQTFDIGEGEVFVIGDNRNHSTDSRHIGAQPIDKVDGVVIADFKSDLLLTFKKTMNQFASFVKPF